jgi:hypothetical protein
LEGFFHFFTLVFLIFLIVSKRGNECLKPVMRENKQEGGKIEKKKGKEINKGKRITES